jgi:hypothetical protein
VANLYEPYTITTDDVVSSGAVTADIALAAPQPQDIIERRYGTVDYFKRQREPSKTDLIRQFKRVVYSCANINSDSVACKKLRLYVKTSASQRKPRVPTRPVKSAQIDYLQEQYGQTNADFFKEFATIEEVIEHPILRLFRLVNGSNFSDEYSLFKDTQLFLEVVGIAYWFLDTSGSIFGQPNQIWLLPSQYVEPKREPGSKNFVDYYEYNPGTGAGVEKFSPEEILVFSFTDLNNPYMGGLSPTKAAWEDIAIENKLLSHLSGTLENEARPDAMITPDEPIGEDGAALWEKSFRLRYGRGKSGGIWVAPEKVTFTPLQWPIRDIARLDIQKCSKLSIANTFGVPMALLEAQSINRATLEAAQMQHGRYAIRPRHAKITGRLNSPQFINRWDSSGRLFLCFDDPVPEDEQLKLQKNVGLKQAGIITANEAREDYRLPPHPNGDELETSNVSNEKREQARTSGEAEK